MQTQKQINIIVDPEMPGIILQKNHWKVIIGKMNMREYYELKHPKLSVVLSGTPNQVKILIHSSEDGLFSRMTFYKFDGIESWQSVAPKSDRLNLSRYFEELSNEVKYLYDHFTDNQYVFDLA